MDQFTETALINQLAGNYDDADWATIERQLKLIEDEVKELREAVEARDFNKVRGEACDVLFTTHGLQHRAGFNGNADYKEVCESQYRKFDRTMEEAEDTKAMYAKLGVDTYYKLGTIFRPGQGDQNYYVTFSAEDQQGNNGKEYPKGKWLKSCAFLPPMLPTVTDSVFQRLLGPTTNIFHDHLDVCYQCRNNPMGLCAIGDTALHQQVRFGGSRLSFADVFGK